MAIFNIGRSYSYPSHKFYHLHTYKTGSQSMTRTLLGSGAKMIEKGSFPYDLVKQGHTGVAVLRNPIDRFVSTISMYYENRVNWIWKESITQKHRDILDLTDTDAMKNMVEELKRFYPKMYDVHLHPQIDLISDYPVEIILYEDVRQWFKNRFKMDMILAGVSDPAIKEHVRDMIFSDPELVEDIMQFYAQDYQLRFEKGITDDG